jgi:hypothetical protein
VQHICSLSADNIFYVGGHAKCGVVYKGDGVQLTLCVLFMGDGIKQQPQHIFDNMQEWEGIQEKAGEVDSMKASVTNYDTSH